ncbi:MAG: hypothetical protein Athens041674_470 [Parcubacteria group bacterium Athens0416_74]|nr:MAG: hypothetical protein Athens041674_470 [Parcubacteria group bacterium Athens0416_74]
MEQRYELPVSSPHPEDNEDCLGLRGCRYHIGHGALLRAGPPRLHLRPSPEVELLRTRISDDLEKHVGRDFYCAARKHALLSFLLLIT